MAQGFKFKLPITVHHNDIETDDGEDSQDSQDSSSNVQIPNFQTQDTQVAPTQQNLPSSIPQSSGSKLPVQIEPTELDPALFRNLSSTLQNPPLKSDPQYKPSVKRRVLASLVGLGAGASGGPAAGINSATGVLDDKYNSAYQDFLNRSGALEKGVGLEAQLRSASTRGIGGIAQLLNAQNRGDVDLQGKLDTAKENAKTTPAQKNYKQYLDSLSGDENEVPITFQDFLQLNKSGVERISGSGVSATSVQDRAKSGEKFYDRAGKEIDPTSLQPTEKLVAISGGAQGQQRYLRADQHTGKVTQDNITRTYPEYNPGITTTAGAARVGSEREVQATDAAGNQVTQNLITQPLNPSRSSSGLPNVQAPGQSLPNNNNQLPQVTNPGISKTTQPPISQNNGGVGGSRPLNTFSPQEIKRQSDKAGPISSGMSTIFGSQDHPDVESLISYAKLADDPKSTEKIGSVMRLILDKMVEGGGGESVGAEVLGTGVSASLGGLFSWFKNATGITYGIAKSQVQTINKALNSLTDKEKDYVNTAFASFGALGGIRQALGMPAYLWSFNAIKNEVPIIGYSVNDTRSYNNKLSKIMLEMTENIKSAAISKQILPQVDHWGQQLDELNKLSKTPTAPEKKSKYKVEEVQ